MTAQSSLTFATASALIYQRPTWLKCVHRCRKSICQDKGIHQAGTSKVIEAFAVTFAAEQTIRCLPRWHLTT
jgi:hypothetical protein